jgi:hypothetical protein
VAQRIKGTIHWSYTYDGRTPGDTCVSVRDTSGHAYISLVKATVSGVYEPSTQSYIEVTTWVDDGTSRITANDKWQQSYKQGEGCWNFATCEVSTSESADNVVWAQYGAENLVQGFADPSNPYTRILLDPFPARGVYPWDLNAKGTRLSIFPSSIYIGYPGVQFTSTASGCGVPPPGQIILPPAVANPGIQSGTGFGGIVADPHAPAPTIDFQTLPQYQNGSRSLPNGFSETAHLEVAGIVGPCSVSPDFAEAVSNAVKVFAVGHEMRARFIPNCGLTLQKAAQLGGFDHFNWLQKITQDADVSVKRCTGDAQGYLDQFGTCPNVPYSDPPPGGYSYQIVDCLSPRFANSGPDSRCKFPIQDPFEWYLDEEFSESYNRFAPVSVRKAAQDNSDVGLATSLLFSDEPSADVVLKFRTFLVGVRADGSGRPIKLPGTSFEWEATPVSVRVTSSPRPINTERGVGNTLVTFSRFLLPGEFPPVPGDLNGDGTVDCADLAIIKASFGKRRGEAGYDSKADVNNDGVVDVKDLAFVSQKVPAGTKCP